MRNHSVESLKDHAAKTWCVLACDETGAGQRVRGITVTVEHTTISCLLFGPAGSCTWIMGGAHVTESEVRAYLDEGHADAMARMPPMSISEEDSLKKFDAWRESVIPQIAARAQTQGGDGLARLAVLNNQWERLYLDPRNGLLRMYGMRSSRASPPHWHSPQPATGLPADALRAKIDEAERGCFEIAQSFLDECTRLGLSPAEALA